MKSEIDDVSITRNNSLFYQMGPSYEAIDSHVPMPESENSRIKLIKVRSVSDARGTLSVADSADNLPFVPRRVYWLHGGAVGTIRGGHAHRKLEQLLVAMFGVYEIALDDGERQRIVRLESPTDGLLISPIVWREIRQVSPMSSLAVLASLPFDPDDYVHDYDEFLRLSGANARRK